MIPARIVRSMRQGRWAGDRRQGVDTLSDDTASAKTTTRRPIDFRRIGLVWTILLLPIEIGAAIYDPGRS